MRSSIRSLDAILRCAVLFPVMICCVGIHAQQNSQQPRIPQLPADANPSPIPDGLDPQDPHVREMARQMALKRAIMRQQEIEDDTAKLLSLAQELKTDVSKSTKDQLSLDVIKKAEEIEKLAKSVKDKMKSGQ
jgi:hypothetical protein